MKLSALLFFVVVGLAAAKVAKNVDKDYLTKTNRVPKEPVKQASVEEFEAGLDVCAECKEIVAKIDTLLQDQSKIAEVKFFMNMVCDMIPSAEEKEMCKSMVANTDAIIHELQPLLADPAKFCASVDLCGSGRATTLTKVLLVIAKYKVYQFAGVETASGALCDECKFAITELKTVWDEKSIQDEVKQMLDNLCNSLGAYKDTCVNLVDQYFPLLVTEIDQLLADPTTTCSELGLCSSALLTVRGFRLTKPKIGKVTLHKEAQSEFLTLLNRMRRVQTRSGTSTGCTVCVYSVGALLETLKIDPDILNSWAAGIENICSEFPGELKSGCTDFLGIYLEPVLRVTVDSVSPKDVCTMIKACDASKYEQIMEYRSHGRLSSEVVCESCRLLTQFLKTELQQSAFQDEIKTELKQVCNFVPGQYSNTCEEVVELYVPYLLKIVITELEPDTICPELKLCEQSQPVSAKEEELAIEQQILTEEA